MAHVTVPDYIPMHRLFSEDTLSALKQLGLLLEDTDLVDQFSAEEKKGLMELAALAQETLNR